VPRAIRTSGTAAIEAMAVHTCHGQNLVLLTCDANNVVVFRTFLAFVAVVAWASLAPESTTIHAVTNVDLALLAMEPVTLITRGALLRTVAAASCCCCANTILAVARVAPAMTSMGKVTLKTSGALIRTVAGASFCQCTGIGQHPFLRWT